jgi:hypothetical protein
MLNCFDKIYCINLNKRTDRWNNAKEQFIKFNLLKNVYRFPAIEKTDGRVGCINSHIEILKDAKLNNYKNILVFEDDFLILNENFIQILNDSYSQLPNDWNLLYLGANVQLNLPKYSENLILLTHGYATHAIAYNYNIYDFIISKYDNCEQITDINDCLDVWYSRYIQSKGKSFLIKPLLVTQMNSYSDIQNRDVDYTFIEKRYNDYIK